MPELLSAVHNGRMTTSKKLSPSALRAALKASGLTQRALAKKANVTEAFFSKLKKGDVGASSESLDAIAKALGVSPANLVMPEVAAPVGPEAPPEGLLEFLAGNEAKLGITKRERWYLLQSRFRAEPWVVFDDAFWLQMLKFWREFLKENNSV